MSTLRNAFLLAALAPAAWGLGAPLVHQHTRMLGATAIMELSWEAIPGATLYRVRLGESPELQALVAEVTEPQCRLEIHTGWNGITLPHPAWFASVTAEGPWSLDLVALPAGTFGMGWGEGVPVTLTHPFLLGRAETTNGQFVTAVQWAWDHGHVQVVGNQLRAHGVTLLELAPGTGEIAFAGGVFSAVRALHAGQWGYVDAEDYMPDDHPVQGLSWYGAALFCDWLSLMEGLPPYYEGQWDQVPATRDPYAAQGYRLPTEAEWEYAAQFDADRSRIHYPWGNAVPTCGRANYLEGTPCVGWTLPVGRQPAGDNSVDIHDMGGNVWEWCNDWIGTGPSQPTSDPAGSSWGSFRCVRGGSWCAMEGTMALQNAHRGYFTPTNLEPGLGVRVVRLLP
jgi:formylglycine-generating enzyme required for sulfatase activity